MGFYFFNGRLELFNETNYEDYLEDPVKTSVLFDEKQVE